MKGFHRVALLSSALVVLAGAPALAKAPATVAVEGALHAAGGGPVADGSYAVTFAIYDKEQGGTAVWSEGPVNVKTIAGRFAHALGSLKTLDTGKLAGLPAQWLGLKVGGDPELARRPLRSAMFALHASSSAALACSGCVGGGQIAAGAVTGQKVGFAYAASDTKGGSALKAKALSCTGCVTVAHLKFDKGVDLGAQTLTAAKLISGGDIQAAGVIAAKQFVGDGSKLTGIKVPANACPKGRVASGIDADGKLTCVVAGGDLDSVSGGLFTQHFSDTFASAANKDIPDFNSNGLLDSIAVPDLGTAEKIEVSVEISKAPFVDLKPKDGKPDYDPTDLTVLLFPPSTKALPAQRSNIVNNFLSKPDVKQGLYPNYVLHQGGDAGKLVLVATYPTKTKPVAGDLTEWVGKNPKGSWRLLVLDNGDRVDAAGKDVKLDGKLVSWSVKIGYKASKQFKVNGDLVFDEGGKRVTGARIKQATAAALGHGKSIALGTGTKDAPLIAQAWFWNAKSKRWIQANAGSAGASDCTACGTSADGDYKASGNTTLSTSKVWNFKDFIIPKGITVTASGTSALEIRATGKIDIQGTLLLDGGQGGHVTNNSSGCLGGSSKPGKGGPGGYDGGYGNYNSGSSGFYDGKGPGPGRKGAYNWSGGCGSGGGGGGHAATGSAGQGSAGAGGSNYTSVEGNNLRGGSGGGAGGYGSWYNATGAGGGGGGGAVKLTGAEVIIAGKVSANGGNGGRQYNNCDGGDGGGGAGGAIWIRGGKVNLSGATITALGGSRGHAPHSNECGGSGGNGAVGRIRVDAQTSPIGSTNPKFVTGTASGLAPPISNSFRIEHTADGLVSLTNDSGAAQNVRLVVTY